MKITDKRNSSHGNHNMNMTVQHKLLRTVALCAILSFAATTTYAATYYIDSANGKDANPGTSVAPWKTMNRAYPYVVSRNWGMGDPKVWYTGNEVVAGDTVIIRDGNYGYITWSSIINTGWITYQADTGHTPHFKSLYLNCTQTSPSGNATYIRLKGLHFEPASYGDVAVANGGWIVLLDGVKYIDIDGCYIKGLGEEEWWGYGLGIQAGSGSNSCYVTVQNTTVYDTENSIGVGQDSHHLTFTNVKSIKTGDNGVSGSGLCDSLFVGCEFSGTFTYHDGVLLDGNATVSGTFINGEAIVQAVTGAHGVVVTPPAGWYAANNVLGDDWVTPYFYRNGRFALFISPGSRKDANGVNYAEGHGFDTVHQIEGQTSHATMTPSIVCNNSPHHLDLVQLYQTSGTPSPQNDLLCNNLVFSGCIFKGSSDAQGLFLKGQSNLLIENCLFYGDTITHICSIADHSISGTIRNNTIYSTNLYNAVLEIYGNPLGTFNVYNNVIAGSFGAFDKNYNDQTYYSGIVNVKNNIIGRCAGSWTDYGPDATNYVYSTNRNSLTSEELAELFTDPAANDFTPKAGSLAIGKGNTSYAPISDILGNSRPIPPSVGCYEYSSAVPGGTTPGDTIPTPAGTCVGYWKFDEGAGSIAGDSASLKNNGTIAGASWCAGKVNTALSFNGIDNYVNMRNSSSLDLTGSLTVSAWILPTTYGQNGYGCIMHKGTAANGFSVYLDGSTASLAYAANGAQPVESNPNVIVLNTWQYVTVTYDAVAGQVVFYVNSQVVGTAAYSTSPGDSSSAPLLLGYNSGQAFAGLIDEVRIVNTALSQKNISIFYVLSNKYILDITAANGAVQSAPQSTSYYPNTSVTLTAVANDGYEFSNWAGDLTGTANPVAIVMDKSKTVEAVFTKIIVNTSPTFVDLGPQSVTAGTTLTFKVQAVDAENDAITYTAQNLPAGASFAADGTFSWTPQTAGTYPVIFTASDGNASSVMTVTITVLASGSDGLVLNMHMDDSPADGVFDSSAYGNNGTSTSLPSLVSGYFNNGYLFDGVHNFVSVTDSASLDVKKLTLGAWICVNKYQNDQRIIAKEFGKFPPYTIYSLLLGDTSAKKLQLRLGIGNVRKIVTSKADIPLNTWTHVAATFDGVIARLYINGRLDTSTVIIGQIMVNKNPVYIGACQFYPWFFAGVIDDAVIYNRALTASEIAGLMQGNDNAPVLAAIADKQIAAGQTLTFQLACSDVDGDALSYSAANMPNGASLNGNVFTWTPDSSQAGIYDVAFTVSDGKLSAVQTVVITVTQ